MVMDGTMRGVRRVVVSVTPRLLSDSLVTVLADRGLDVVAAPTTEAGADDLVVIAAGDDAPPRAGVVVRLVTATAGPPCAVVDVPPDGPSARIEGMSAIVQAVVDITGGSDGVDERE